MSHPLWPNKGWPNNPHGLWGYFGHAHIFFFFFFNNEGVAKPPAFDQGPLFFVFYFFK